MVFGRRPQFLTDCFWESHLLLTVGRTVSIFNDICLVLLECPKDIVSCQVTNPRKRAKRKPQCLCDVVSEIKHHQFHHILVVKTNTKVKLHCVKGRGIKRDLEGEVKGCWICF